MIKPITSADLPTSYGMFRVHVFDDDGQEHLALTYGDFPLVNKADEILLRIHSECLTGDGLFSLRCDCGPQLAQAMERVEQSGRGMIVYLRQEGRGIGLVDKIKAYALQDQGEDTVSANIKLGHPADKRNYGMVGPILSHFGISKVRLMTNNPQKIRALEEQGIDVVERLPLKITTNIHNAHYLQVKKERMQHFD